MKTCLLLYILVLLVRIPSAQSVTYNFHQVTQGDGLNEGLVIGIGQDKYGYIWIGTHSGLNRYDGYSVKNYLHIPGDSLSIFPEAINAIHCSEDGNLWIGGDLGLMKFNYDKGNFQRIKSSRPLSVNKMIQFGKDTVLLSSDSGLAFLQSSKGNLKFFSEQLKLDHADLLDLPVRDMYLMGKTLFITISSGIIRFNLETNTIRLTSVEELGYDPYRIIVELTGRVWLTLTRSPALLQCDTSFSKIKVYPYLFPELAFDNANHVNALLLDRQGRLWLTTAQQGVCLYNREKDSFQQFMDEPLLTRSPAVNHFTRMFQDRQGLIWIASRGFGLSYFHPDQQLFKTVLPRTNQLTAGAWMWGRGAAEDASGNLWFATASGIIRQDKETEKFKTWRNEPGTPEALHHNAVRCVLADSLDIWILTSGGVNKYNHKTGQIEFLTEEDGLPKGNYIYGLKDSNGRTWFTSADSDGLYYADKGSKKFVGIKDHPVLKKINGLGTWSIFEDTQRRLWLGLNGFGLVMYDPANETLRSWPKIDNDEIKYSGKVVTSITEDHNGIIWTTSFSGLSSINMQTGETIHYSQENGLPAIKTGGLQVDDQNRLWIGSAKGMILLDSTRRHFKLFDVNDGLPTYEFADMPSFKTADGRFLYPTMKGFVIFNPNEYLEAAHVLTFYVSNFDLVDEPYRSNVNIEEVTQLRLKPNENFFSFTLTALNYLNPMQSWYAYKLDGLDQEWHYTKNRVVNYTNVPGGLYTFRYKASTDEGNWSGLEKTIQVHVASVFYKTAWYWSLVAAFVLVLLYFFYRFRIAKQKQILNLETKAQSLEKEKTVVQYESLKQQLNPHFLFNSLTSLRSLIKTDPKEAASFLDGMSKVYRYILKSDEKEWVPLSDELDFTMTYMHLQKIRFKDGLRVSTQIQESDLSKNIAPATLQNLVENAIKHNTADVESPLVIEIYSEHGFVVVKNNLQRYRIVETSNKRGLNGLKSLYMYYSDTPIQIDEDGESFIVKIPLL